MKDVDPLSLDFHSLKVSMTPFFLLLGLRLSISSSQGSYKNIASLEIEVDEDLMK